MPGWHEATKDLLAQGKIQVAGIIQEQHPDRCRLFMQWKRMDWPILADSLNLLEVEAVPITLFIDEHGVIRKVNPALKNAAALTREFLETKYDAPAKDASAKQIALTAGDREFLWGGEGRLAGVLSAYQKAAAQAPRDGRPRFRLGVAYRKRHDSALRQPEDFQLAVNHWQQALDLDPNQYIWRRRIQQYGPRLDKPYPFYDWVPTAREEIRARGEAPTPLTVEPGGAEFAAPLKKLGESGPAKEPDARGRIHRDKGTFIEAETTVVPASVTPGAAARFHAAFRPLTRKKAHWNNEAEGLVLWVNPPAGWTVDTRYVAVENPPTAVSQEVRRVEFEAQAPAGAAAGAVTIPAYALYYVCEDVNGTCLYRRQDLSFRVNVTESSKP